MEKQSASAVLMIRPVRFQGNPETAESNTFQQTPDPSLAEAQQAAALEEFEVLASALREAGVDVLAFDDTPEPHTPDAIFPNNWVSFHADGTVVLYPMMAANRRAERRLDILEHLSAEDGFKIERTIDLTHHENQGHALEGTGSLILDRVHRVAYACLSPRTHLDPMGEFAQRLDYDIMAFDAVGPDGTPIYHTNVMMALGERYAIICAEAVSSETQRDAVLTRLTRTGHEVVDISFTQMGSFAGNMLELENSDGEKLLVASARAASSLTQTQRAALSKHARIVSVPISRIEDAAGGSVRCMLAEIHLPRKHPG